MDDPDTALAEDGPELVTRGGGEGGELRAEPAALLGEEGGVFGDVPLVFEHLGYEGDLTHKHERNLPLLRRAVLEDPERLYLWSELGRAAAALGDEKEAVRAFREGVRLARAEPGGDLAALSFTDLLNWLLTSEAAPPAEAEALANEALALFADNPDVRWMAGHRFAARGRHAAALECFEWLLAANSLDFEDAGTAFDRNVFGLCAAESAGMCCFMLARSGEAYAHFKLAAELAPDSLELRMKVVLAAKRAGIVT